MRKHTELFITCTYVVIMIHCVIHIYKWKRLLIYYTHLYLFLTRFYLCLYIIIYSFWFLNFYLMKHHIKSEPQMLTFKLLNKGIDYRMTYVECKGTCVKIHWYLNKLSMCHLQRKRCWLIRVVNLYVFLPMN